MDKERYFKIAFYSDSVVVNLHYTNEVYSDRVQKDIKREKECKYV